MWWEKEKPKPVARAVAYYRHSAQDRQENSIPIQQEQVQKFARDHGIEIIKEFADAGKSGLSTEDRDGFTEMLDKYIIEGTEEFKYVFVLDVSRWGRFQDLDLSAYYSGLCLKYNKRVVYTSIGFPKDDDMMHNFMINMERYRAATYSRDLSDKVFKGCVKISQQGYSAGGPPAYGLNRLLLDEKREPVHVLEQGQRKSIQNQRVTLAPAQNDAVTVVRKIFKWFVRGNLGPTQIASALNAEEIPSPAGSQWTSGSIRNILRNEQYTGTMVYNKTGGKLKTPRRRNPLDKWVRTQGAFECVVEREMFDSAQQMLEAQAQELKDRYSDDGMVRRLGILRDRYGFITPSLVAAEVTMATPSTYGHHFGSMDMAYQQLHADVLDRVRKAVIEELKTHAQHLEEHDDFIVLDRSFSILIQPSVPAPIGYREYWSFRPDQRKEVDITLGVPLSNDGEYKVLGYLALPRLLMRNTSIRVFDSSIPKLELYGYSGLNMIWDLIEERKAQ